MPFKDSAQVKSDAVASGWRRALLVTALPLEMSAVRKHLTEFGSCQGRDGNVFELGRFVGPGSEWLVVVGESGAGNHLSQGTVTNACIELGPFEIIVFVGVAATRKPDDAPIGSVVISDHVYFPYVGKYQSGGFNGRPREFPVNPQLLGLARKVARDEKWHERLKPPYGGLNPGDDLYPKPFPPSAKTAPIVSVEAVSADLTSSLEQLISSNYQDSTALEMEGYGVMLAAFNEDTPGIIVRGISDDRAGKDPKLDKFHQPIAAAHAAAFAYELLELWSDNKLSPQEPTIVAAASAPEALASTSLDMPALVPAGENATDGKAALTVVLNFSGDEDDFPEEKQLEILEAVRSITGNPAIEIVGSEIGSFHLFLSVLEADLKLVQSKRLREILIEKFGIELVGVLTKAEFEATRSDIDRLKNASHAVLDWPRTLPDGTAIARPELSQLLEVGDSEDGHTQAVIGDPGSGKTALLAALAQTLRKERIPFLAIKADVLDVTISTEQDLQRELALPELPSVMLERLSLGRPVFLIIDQLDALAGYIDLRTGRLNVLLNLVRALGNRRNVHIVLSARRFEYEHDTRLKTVRAESVLLELPPWSTVLKILEAQGIQAAGWPDDAQQVMRSPQSLATLLRLTEVSKSEPFGKYQKMLERLWGERVLSRANGNRLSTLAGRIAEEMAERETMWLASSRYDADVDDLNALVAEKILTSPAGSPGSIGFSHQTIFEFALARAFAQQEGRLSGYVRERVSSLFIRPKIWAALTYLRDVEAAAYEIELRSIWSLPQLRLHLRHLIIEFLGQQTTPENVEREILDEAVKTSDRRTVLQSIIGSPGWFAYFKNTEIAKAMNSEAEAGVASAILSRASEFATPDVLGLIEKHWRVDKTFDGYTWHILQDTSTWSDSHLSLAQEIVGRTNIASFAFDHMVSTLGADQPLIAIKLVRARLDSMLREAKADAEAKREAQSFGNQDRSGLAADMESPAQAIVSVIERSDGWDALDALAKAAPASFLEDIWPWFKDALDTIKGFKEADDRELSFAIPYSVDFRFEDESSLNLPSPSLLSGIRSATEAFAAEAPEAFLTWFDSVENENATPAQRLLAHTLSTQPEKFAERALSFLIDDTRRFNLGSIEDYSGTTKRLIEAVGPFWHEAQILRFVKAVIAFSPRPGDDRDPKSRQNFYQYVERIRYELLAALPAGRLTPEADALVKQGERKFGVSKRGAVFSGPSWVGPSMSADEIDHAADEDILNAFENLPDATGWDNPKTWRKGGNIQLSRSFAEFAKISPKRAIEIIRKFTPDIGARAAGYAIDTMAEVVDGSLLLPLIKELDGRGFASEEYRGGVARAVEKLINKDIRIDDGTLSVLEGWLASPLEKDEPNGDTDDKVVFDDATEDKKERRSESILWGMGGFSILPQGNFPILEAITRIYLQRKDYARLLRVLSSHVERPEAEQVWTALFRLLPYIRIENKVELAKFYRALFDKFPSITASAEAVVLFAHIHWSVPDLVRDVLSDWKKSSSDFVQQAYGELAGLLSLMRPELDWPNKLVSDILASDSNSPMRTGAAFAAVHVWAEMPEKTEAPRLIRELTKNASENTWKAVIDLFRLVDEITPDAGWVEILRTIAAEIPRQSQFMSSFVIERLQTLLPHEAELVAKISKALVEKWSTDLADLRTAHASIAPELVDIAITLHRLGPRTREAGLEVFEQLLVINAYMARETLDQVDNRFRTGQPAPRRRLPRRTARARRANRRRIS